MNHILSDENVAMAFGTPVSTYLWQQSEELNAGLSSLVLGKENGDPGLSHSNVGGWHSSTDLLSWPADEVTELRDRIFSMSRDLIGLSARQGTETEIDLSIEAWANVHRHGNYSNIHDHPTSVWSGVYYVSAGTPENTDPANGRLELIDPRQGVSMVDVNYGTRSGRFLVEPIPGLMIMFPSWLRHMVHPFFGKGERISIAFNVRVRKPISAEPDTLRV